MTERLLSAFIHATVGWVVVGLVCLALRRFSPSLRCWAWRLGVVKGPIALLMAVPVAIGLPAPLDLSSLEAPGAVRSVQAQGVESVADAPVAPVGSSSGEFLVLAYGLGMTLCLARLVPIRRIGSDMPRVEGVFRPRVVLPSGMGDSAARIAIAHEEAHIRRRDPLWSLVADLCCSALWFSPATWLCARGMRMEAEAACDAEALARTGAKPSAYAHLLLSFAGPAPHNALGGPARRLFRRITMLNTSVQIPSRTFGLVLVLMGLGVALPWKAVALPQGKSALSSGAPSVPPIFLPLDIAAQEMIRLPGVKRQIGWTNAQESAEAARSARWNKVYGDYAARLLRVQKTRSMKDRAAFAEREQPKSFRAASQELGPYPWTPEQRAQLAVLALNRYGTALWNDREVAARLSLTSTQKRALAAETMKIANATRHLPMPTSSMTVLHPGKPIPAAVQRRVAVLRKKSYSMAPGTQREALDREIQLLMQPFNAVYGEFDEKEFRAGVRARVRRLEAMRSSANARLESMLSAEQQSRLRQLRSEPSAWQNPIP